MTPRWKAGTAAVLTVIPVVTLLSGVALMRRREAVSGGGAEVM